MLAYAREHQEEAIKSEIFADPKVGALIRLEMAKRILSEGDTLQATEIIDALRKLDFATVYFWGAVAHQCRHIENHYAIDRILEVYGGEKKLIALSILSLIEILKHPEGKHSFSSYYSQSTLDYRWPFPFSVSERAQRYLGQLQARDKAFVEALLGEQLSLEDLSHLEQISLSLSPDDDRRYQAAVHALSSLELLGLAEAMKRTAEALPFTGTFTADLRKDVEMIIEQSQSLTLPIPLLTDQIEELARLL